MLSFSMILVLLMNPAGGHTTMDEADVLRFNEIAQKASAAEQDGGSAAAIAVYEDAIADPANRDYGQLHLRLAQLLVQQDRFAAAAYHFDKCRKDVRVDPLDRNIICKSGYEKATAPLEIIGLPPGGTVMLLEPSEFQRDLRSGDRVPKGMIKVVVKTDGRKPQISEIAVNGPRRWRAHLGMLTREGQLVPEGFLENTDGSNENSEPALDVRNAPLDDGDAIRWPAYTSAVVGLALVGAGIGIGMDNRSALEALRVRQGIPGRCGPDRCNNQLGSLENKAQLADGLWIGGATVAASSILWWYLFDGENP